MRSFNFSLRRVLEWRRTELGLEESKLQQLGVRIQELDVASKRLDLVRNRAEETVRQSPTAEATDLWALAAYRRRLMTELQALAERKRTVEQQMVAQRQKVVEAQRQCRLLEKLEERRRTEWRIQTEREMESLASESFLAAWNRRHD